MSNPPIQYPDIFNELKTHVREAGLLERVPVRGSLEMIAILVCMTAALGSAAFWNPILLCFNWVW